MAEHKPGLRERHWHKMSEICGQDITPDAGTTLRKIKNLGLEEHMDDFEMISGAASKEFSLEKTLEKMLQEWEPISFNLVEYRIVGLNQNYFNFFYVYFEN